MFYFEFVYNPLVNGSFVVSSKNVYWIDWNKLESGFYWKLD